MSKILLVDDDVDFVFTLKDVLEAENYIVESVHTGKEAAEFLNTYKYDVIVLDWDLPDLAGVEICREFRERGGKTPVLMLTGKGLIENRTEGLDAGADDYLTKPFHVSELCARLRALLRRVPQYQKDVLQVSGVELDPMNHQVTVDGQDVKLFPKDYALLEFLMRHPNQYFEASALLDHVWSSEENVATETVRQSIHRLRSVLKTKDGPSLIENLRGAGYRIKGDGN